MKITEHLLKLSGADYGTNSNTYGVIYDGGIVLIDCGYGELQWNQMASNLEAFGYSMKQVSHCLLTHGHFDHCRNAHRVNELGAKLCCSKEDVKLIEEGNPESEMLFGEPWIKAKADEILEDGQILELDENTRITVMRTPGHSAGSLSFLIEVDGIKAATTGDGFWTVPVPPKDDVTIELGFMGSSDFSMSDFRNSLKAMAELDFDILLPGHYYIYRGPKLKELTKLAYEAAMKLEA